MNTSQDPDPPPSPDAARSRFVVVWPAVLGMLAAVAFTLLVLVDWTGTGQPRELLIVVPALLGILGAVGTMLVRAVPIPVRALWALASVVCGIAVVPLTMVMVLLLSGP